MIQPLPKKSELIKKPEIKEYKEREQKNRAKIEEIIEKKVSQIPLRKPSGQKSLSSTAPKSRSMRIVPTQRSTMKSTKSRR